MHRALTALALAAAVATPVAAAERPNDFVDLSSVAPNIVVEMRYHGGHNFVAKPVRGYQAPVCLLTRPAAEALARVQARLEPHGLGLKVYDCYRPQRAVDHFVEWAKDQRDTVHQSGFYPMVPKSKLFEEGYIADRSGHSRGSTVDLTIIPLPAPAQAPLPIGNLPPCTAAADTRPWDNSLEMGTGYDCFDPQSWTESAAVGAQARANRLLLRALMEAEGFVNYPKEWWHFTLANEPYPDRRFDFPIDQGNDSE